MENFIKFLEEKIAELRKRSSELEKDYQSDNAVFAKIECNVYDIAKTVFTVFQKTKGEKLLEEYGKKLDEFEETWRASAEKAKQFGYIKEAAAGEAKLKALKAVKEKFKEVER